MPLLPVSRAGGGSRNRRGGAVQPSAADVQTVNPAIGRDPGVNVPNINIPEPINVPSVRAPEGAFDSGLGQAANEFAPAVDDLAQDALRRQIKMEEIAAKQQRRRDLVLSSGYENEYQDQVDLQLREMTVAEREDGKDLSDEEVLSEYGFMTNELKSQYINALIEQGASEDSIADLTIRLNDIEADARGRAAGLSTTLGKEKLDTVINKKISSFGANAAKDPSIKGINQQLVSFRSEVDRAGDLLDEGETAKYLKAGTEHIVLSAVDGLVKEGRIEQAETILEDPSTLNALDFETQRSVRNRIQTVRTAKNAFLDDVRAKEEFLGRPMTQDEKLKFLKIAPSVEKLTAKEQERQGYLDRGFSENMADDLANKQVKVVGPDPTGKYYTVNAVTGERRQVEDVDAKVITDSLPQSDGDQAQNTPQPDDSQTDVIAPQRSIESAVEEGTGPFANIKAGFSNLVGGFVDGQFYEDTTNARTQIRAFNQFLKTAFVNNPRFPVAEQSIVQGFLPNVDTFFNDPDTERSNLQELRKSLTTMMEAKTKELSSGEVTTERRGILLDNISRINETLTMMESPAEGGDGEVAVGDIMTDANGNRAKFLGGDKNDPKNWEIQ